MTAPDGHCWLCGKFGKLTKEHIPPQAAFNDFPLLYEKITERSKRTGSMEWEAGEPQQGLYFRSLCEQCNNRYGRIYGSAYVNLVRRVAERVGDVQEFHRISITGIQYPLRILKQIMLQFVTANGPNFVRANDWVAPFIRDKDKRNFPDGVYAYVFASNATMSRKSGVSAFRDLLSGRTNVVAEFTFWPLGTLMSFNGELPHKVLTPIHHLSRYPFDYSGSVTLDLSVNPVNSAYPVDFRTMSQVRSARAAQHNPSLKTPSSEDLRELHEKAMRVSGEEEKRSWIYSGHPTTFDAIRQQRK